MLFNYSPPAVAVRSLLLIGALGGAFQSVQAADDADNSELIEVLGTRIKRVDREGASPILSIGREEIAQKGYANVSEVLGSLNQVSGQEEQVLGSGYTPSASSAALRGFGVGRTLVLVDGRRIPQFPGAYGGVDNFVDLTMIPSVAVERIDVLSDGASAIYGSDAISGVINIVLRKDLEGHNLAVRGGMTEQGGGASQRLQYAGGFSDETSRAAVYAEVFKRDALRAADRARSRSSVLRPGVGSIVNYGNNFVGDGGAVLSSSCDPARGFAPAQAEDGTPRCGFDRAYRDELQSSLDRYSVQGTLDHTLSDTTSLFVRAGYVNSQVDTAYYDTGYRLPVALDAANNPTRGTAEPFAGSFERFFSEFSPVHASETQSLNLTAGIDGQFDNGLDWQTALTYGEQQLDTVYEGMINERRLTAAVQDGSLNLLNPIDAPTRERLAAHPAASGKSSLLGADFQVSGDAFEMSAGPALFAAVVEVNHQQYTDSPNAELQNGEVINLGTVSADGERDYAALGAELLLPLHETLNLNLAGRYDHYMDDSNVGGAFSPKLALEYRPLDGLLLRASAGRSFRAPDMQRLFGGETTGVANDVLDTPGCLAAGGQPGDENYPLCVNIFDAPYKTRANIQLEEEKGQNYNIGAVWQPLAGLSMNADLWQNNLSGMVVTPFPQQILDFPERYPGQFSVDPARATGQNPRGLLLDVMSFNMAELQVSGIDAGVNYDWEASELGSFAAALSGSYVATYKSRDYDGGPVFNDLDGKEGRANGDTNAQASLSWKRNEWSAMLFADYTGAHHYWLGGEVGYANLGSYTKVNLNAAYDLPWEASIAVGVNNVLDREPPLLDDGGARAEAPFTDLFRGDLIGRAFYAEYSQRF